jgi:hypothetical protein
LGQYTQLAEEFRVRRDSFWIRQPSWENPHISQEWLDNEREKLFARGEEEVWYREYEAKFVIGGRKSIFPMFDRNRHVRPHNSLMAEIRRDAKRLQWSVIADPGSTPKFGVLFVAYNPHSKKIYVLDEIYEGDQYNTSVQKIYPRITFICEQLYPNSSIIDEWVKIYDEAATWFTNEVMNYYGVYFSPTHKHLHKKDAGLSLIKDQLLHDVMCISDRCVNLCTEMENYVSDGKGNLPKSGDHLIDCLRYGNAALNITPEDTLNSLKQKNDEERTRYNLKDELNNLTSDTDWTLFPKWW